MSLPKKIEVSFDNSPKTDLAMSVQNVTLFCCCFMIKMLCSLTKIERCFYSSLCHTQIEQLSDLRNKIKTNNQEKNASESSDNYNAKRRHARQDIDLSNISSVADYMQNVIDERSFGCIACVHNDIFCCCCYSLLFKN